MKSFARLVARWRFGIVIGVMTMLAMAVSLMIGLQQSVWFDEAYAVIVAKQPLTQLLHFVSLDTHPPLYYLLLKAWAHIFGWGELALRSLSVLLMGGTIIVAALLMRRLFGARAAFLTVVLLVVSPFVLRYGFEIRMYSLATLIGLIATYVLVIARGSTGRKSWWWYGLYAAIVVIGVYTLYYLVFLWLAHLIWLVWTLRDKRVLFRQPWAWTYAASVLAFLPWLKILAGQLATGDSFATVLQQVTALNMIGMLSFWFLYTPEYGLNGLSSLVIVALIVALVVLIGRGLRTAGTVERQALRLFACYVGIPILVVALISMIRPFYIERYMAPVMVGMLLLIGGVTTLLIRRGWRPVRWLYLGIVVVSGVGVWQLLVTGNYNFQRLDRPDGRRTAALVASRCQDATVIFNTPYLVIDESYYYTQCRSYFLSEENPKTTGGYGILHDSHDRVTRVGALDGRTTAIFIHYDDDPAVTIAPGYNLIDTRQVDKLVIDTYVLAKH